MTTADPDRYDMPDAYDSSAGAAPVYTRLYRPYGRYAHLRCDDGSRRVLCHMHMHIDMSSTDYGWLGTGCQAEYEQAARLPLCPLCWERREAQLMDSRLGRAHG
jgi:hypothetical protein